MIIIRLLQKGWREEMTIEPLLFAEDFRSFIRNSAFYPITFPIPLSSHPRLHGCQATRFLLRFLALYRIVHCFSRATAQFDLWCYAPFLPVQVGALHITLWHLAYFCEVLQSSKYVSVSFQTESMYLVLRAYRLSASQTGLAVGLGECKEEQT
jgi:hypothetical protein